MIIPQVRTIVSGVIAISAMLVCASLLLIPFRLVFFAVSAGWCAVFALLIRRFSRFSDDRNSSVFLAVFTSVALFVLVSLIEWRPLLWGTVLLFGVATFLIAAMALAEKDSTVHTLKEWRRVHVALLTFDAGALMTGLYAVGIFFPATPFWLLMVFGGLVFGVTSWLIWRLYHDIHLRSHGAWFGIFTLFMAEVMWAMHLLPFGYGVSGVLTVWLWYIAQLFARFHFGAQGIRWANQRTFLVFNAAAYGAVLAFFVRWV